MSGGRLTPEAIKARLSYEAFYRNELGDLRPGSNGNALALCPFHDDRDPSLSVSLKTGLWRCFGCDAAGDVFEFYMRKHNCDFPTALAALACFANLDPGEEARPGEKDQGLTLEQYAAAKKLPEDFLRSMGVKEARGKDGRPYLVFEYRDLNSQIIPEASRMRFSMAEKPKARRGGKPAVYGLWRIPEMLAEDGELLILEGESDALTAWHHGLPALGIPGKNMTHLLDPRQLDGFNVIYVWQEPGAEDFPPAVAKVLPGFRVLRMIPPEGLKDLSEAHCRGLDALSLVRGMQREAIEVTTAADAGGRDARSKTLSFIINFCKKHANEGGDKDICQQLIDFLGRFARERNIAQEVRDWALLQPGYFMVTDCYGELDLVTNCDKTAARVALHRLVREGVIEPHGNRRGCYRLVERDCELIDFLGAPDGPPLPLRWPLALERLVKLYPKNLAVVAGSKDAGKTAFCLNFARLNQDNFEVHYFCSEIAAQEFRERLKLFGYPLESWKIKVWERSSNFADVIKPDAINIIDFLEISDSFYLIAQELRAIYDKLRNGIALVAIQKDPQSKLGRGATFSLEKARLYVTLDVERGHNNILTIVSGKNWASNKNPRGVTRRFKLVGGAKIIDVEGA